MSKETRNGRTFKAFMKAVDRELIRRCGLDSMCLADNSYWDMWNDEMSPVEVAQDTLEYEGFPR